MSKKVLATLGGLAAVVGLVALSGFAGHCGGHPRSPAELSAFVTDRVDDTLDDLDATPAQRQQVNALKDRLLARATDLHAQGEPVHQEVLAQWNSDSPDRARLHALVDQRADAMRALAHEAVDAGVELHGILTPEQRAKVTKKVERLQRWHGR